MPPTHTSLGTLPLLLPPTAEYLLSRAVGLKMAPPRLSWSRSQSTFETRLLWAKPVPCAPVQLRIHHYHPAQAPTGRRVHLCEAFNSSLLDFARLPWSTRTIQLFVAFRYRRRRRFCRQILRERVLLFSREKNAPPVRAFVIFNAICDDDDFDDSRMRRA